MKILKVIGVIGIILIGISIILISISTINHKIQLKREAKEFKPTEDIVRFDDVDFRVFAQGEGDETLVFLAGHGTSNPTMDFKPLWEKLVDDYRIVVVEKAGYGWSDSSNSSRELGKMLDETRQALKLSGEEGPYILVPHSMSGLEAIYWGQTYPDEVKAIIGLDSCTPDAIDALPQINMGSIYLMRAISNVGITRLIPESDMGSYFPLLDLGYFSDEEKELYLLPFYKNYFSKNMINEIKLLDSNVQAVRKNDVPVNIPMYFFISSEQEKSAPGWEKALKDYILSIEDGEFMQLDTGHYVHYEKSDIIANKIKEFIDGKITKH